MTPAENPSCCFGVMALPVSGGSSAAFETIPTPPAILVSPNVSEAAP
jgi:hypothetical protein